MKYHSLLCSFLYITLAVAIPPQNAIDRRLLDACKGLEEFRIAQALCLGASKEITDERDRNLFKVIGGGYDRKIPIDIVDSIQYCSLALQNYPRTLIERFELIDRGQMPAYHHLINELRLGTVNGFNYHGDTILHRAIRNGQSGDNLVKKIVGLRGWFNLSCSLLDIQNLDGDTPLHLVIKSSERIRSPESRRRIALFLVSRGANAAIKDNTGETPITFDVSFWTSLCSSGIQQKISENLCSRISRLLFCRKKVD